MIQRYYIECPVCGKVTVLRVQAGFLAWHPIRFNCGNCKISLYGEATFNAPNITLNMCRGKIINEVQNPNFLLSVSGELLCPKLMSITSNDEICSSMSPFIHATSLMGFDKYDEFKQCIINSLDYILNQQNHFIVCNQLHFLKQDNYLKNELSYLPKDIYPLNNEVDFYRAIHYVNRLFYEIINKEQAKAIANLIFKEIDDFMQNNKKEFLNLIQYFDNVGMLDKWEYNIFQLSKQIIENFHKFIPIIGKKYYSQDINQLEQNYSINTISFEEVEPIYFKCYELLSDMLPILISYNNLKYRNNFETMKSGIKFRKKDIKTITDYISVDSKGFRIDCIDGTEMFDNIVYNTFDRAVRNSIGHFNYEILTQDVFNQTILFKNLKNNNKNETRSLLKICIGMWQMFLAINDVAEIIYQTKKISYITKGIRPTVKM